MMILNDLELSKYVNTDEVSTDLSKILLSTAIPWTTKNYQQTWINDSYIYSLKLALIYRPNDFALHDWILDRMDFSHFNSALRLEILCLIAEYKGCDHPKFQQLFSEKVWLLNQTQRPLKEINLYAKKLPTKLCYAQQGNFR